MTISAPLFPLQASGYFSIIYMLYAAMRNLDCYLMLIYINMPSITLMDEFGYGENVWPLLKPYILPLASSKKIGHQHR